MPTRSGPPIAAYGVEFDYANPYLLDTQDKVAWANALRHLLVGGEWRLGDHCWYRPAGKGTQ